MKTAGQWTLMISGGVGTLLVGLTVFFLVFFPSCAPEYCVRYSPLPQQVVSVYLTWGPKEILYYDLARERISSDLRARAIPALEAVLTSPQSSGEDLALALMALADLGQEANGSIPAVLVAMRSPHMLRDWGQHDSVAHVVTPLGLSPAWRAGLTDRDPWISKEFVQAARQVGTPEAFNLIWDLLRTQEIPDREGALTVLEEMQEYFLKPKKSEFAEKIGSRLDDVIAHGPQDMVPLASGLQKWLSGDPDYN